MVGLMESTTIDICQDILERQGWPCSDPDTPAIQLFLKPEQDQSVRNSLFDEAILKDGDMLIKRRDHQETIGSYYGKYSQL